MKNPFSFPDEYRRLMIKQNLVSYNTHEYSGKSFMCVFFTRFCGVGCPFCFFRSAPNRGESTIADQFSDEGIERFVEFCNQANLGYVLISGGGEPLSQKKAVLSTIKRVQTDRIVLVTSGNWAMKPEHAEKYLSEIEEALKQRIKPCKIVVRVSVSQGHAIKLGVQPAVNLIRIFEKKYPNHPYLKFQIHTFENDPTFNRVLMEFPNHELEIDPSKRASDDEQVIKIIPQKMILRLPSSYSLIVGVSKVFGSSLRPNLHEIEKLNKTMATFDRDLEESEDNNSAVLYNTNGTKGLDWSLNYNGNICLWQNQVNDNQWNIYEDSFEKVLTETFRDPITLSYIEKGCLYRSAIVSEVSPRSVLRYKSISLRDFSGTILFEEEKVRLYYAIRVLQDYHQERRTNLAEIEKLPFELKQLIFNSREYLQKLYWEAKYTILDQYKKKLFSPAEWHDFLELIKLGHYDLTDSEIQEALDIYNQRTGANYRTINDVEHLKGEEIEIRLTKRLMYIKPTSYEKHPQTNQLYIAS